MGKIKFAFPINSIQGAISKENNSFSIRCRNGRAFTYTYERKAPWSDNQLAGRSLFGATTYFSYLILRLDLAAERLESLMLRTHRYNRLSGFVVSLIKSLIEQDETLHGRVLEAYCQYKDILPATPDQIETIKAAHMPLAQNLLERILSAG
ncbi:MAG: hypothetical protein ACI4UO_02155 [Paludibacteraceae bacterium]